LISTRARALGNDFADAHHRLLEELVLAGVVQALGGVENATAALSDLRVGESVDAVLKLLFAAA